MFGWSLSDGQIRWHAEVLRRWDKALLTNSESYRPGVRRADY